MLASSTEITSTTNHVDEPLGQPPSVAPPVKPSSTEVLITPQQVVFGTAAATGARRTNHGGRLAAIVRRMLATDGSGPRRYAARHYGFLEDALLAREMERL
ncbi:hypothetical protein H7K38_12140 [Mycobacterium alsense]|nr:hypothetical protein [Mycobacterium alsense]MCV7379397.1 hypothetical protein [Mycobacterium alsense]